MDNPQDHTHGVLTGVILLFNVICGTGSLTLPRAFEEAGIVLSSVALVTISIFSLVGALSVTRALKFCNETIARDNRIIDESVIDEVDPTPEDSDCRPLLQNTSSEATCGTHRRSVKESSEIVRFLFPKWMSVLLACALFIYLTGDLSIYLVAAGQTITGLLCDHQVINPTMDLSVTAGTEMCSKNIKFLPIHVFRLSIPILSALFICITWMGPQRAKLVHWSSSIWRVIGFTAMIGISVHRSINRNGTVVEHSPEANYNQLPWSAWLYWQKRKKHSKKALDGPIAALVGSSLYAFMCHHSVSRLIEPVRMGSRTVRRPYHRTVIIVFVLVLLFYLSLCISGHYAFGTHISSLYTLNFIDKRYWPINLFIAIMPLIMITSSFPILLHTLAKSCEHLIASTVPISLPTSMMYALIPACTIMPMCIAVFCFDRLNTLVGVTGAYSANVIQNAFPGIMALGVFMKIRRANDRRTTTSIGRCAVLGAVAGAILIAYSALSMGVVTLILAKHA